MSDQEEDIKRTKQLEEARKRVEELKKKTKNKKNKGKKNTQKNEDAKLVEHEEPEDEAKIASQVNSNDEGSEKTPCEDDSNKKEVSITPGDEPIEGSQQAPELNPQGELRKVSKEELEKGQQSPQDPKNDLELDHENDMELETEASTWRASVKKDEPRANIMSTPAPTEEISVVPKETTSHNDMKHLFGDDQSNEADFLTTIKNEKDQNELDSLKKQLEDVVKENKTLKFINMDHETEIEELQNEIELLNSELNAARKELSDVKLQSDKRETEFRMSVQQQQIDNARFETSNFSDQQMIGTMQTNIDRSCLDKWRNWNIDMTTWRSIGSGSIVEF